NANGTATVTLRARDNGGTANGGHDLSAPQTFQIVIQPVNDPPSFTRGADVTIPEDSAAQSISGWATGISVGPPNESSQTLSFIVTVDAPSLFETQPSIASNGTLSFKPAANANGTANVTVGLQDSGGTANGGNNLAAPQMFRIVIQPVNDPPSFTKGADVRVLEDAVAQTIGGWATAIAAGPANEGSQTLTFSVTADTPALFETQPAIAPNGTLSFKPAANANGTANVSVV